MVCKRELTSKIVFDLQGRHCFLMIGPYITCIYINMLWNINWCWYFFGSENKLKSRPLNRISKDFFSKFLTGTPVVLIRDSPG